VVLTREDSALLRGYINSSCGIHLGTEKEYLVIQRLKGLLEMYDCKDFHAFSYFVKHNKDNLRLRDSVISAICTNETSFFRDGHPFEFFRMEILPCLCDLIRKRKSTRVQRKGAKVSILSGGASTGQEPYSLAMLINDALEREYTDIEPIDFSIMATDISSKVLARAMDGIYYNAEVQRGLNQYHLEKHFEKIGNQWYINESIKKLVEFHKVNFIEHFMYLGGFDIIFCRNVLIYFEDEVKRRILDQFYELLHPDGYLILGSTENLFSVTDKFKSIRAHGSTAFVKQ